MNQGEYDMELPFSRKLLIPFGPVCYGITGDHVDLSITHKTETRSIAYFEYLIDDDLGRLCASELLQKYFQIYLHALTTYVLPDPLTGNTFQYAPTDRWNVGNNCSACSARPDPFSTNDGTWHDATYSSTVIDEDEMETAQIQFNGMYKLWTQYLEC